MAIINISKVWIYTTTAYLALAITLFCLARISPYEWDDDGEGSATNVCLIFFPFSSRRINIHHILIGIVLIHIIPIVTMISQNKVWTISNALWFGIGSFLGQGCDILPKYPHHTSKTFKHSFTIYQHKYSVLEDEPLE